MEETTITTTHENTCKECGKIFSTIYPTAAYCSKRCRNRFRNRQRFLKNPGGEAERTKRYRMENPEKYRASLIQQHEKERIKRMNTPRKPAALIQITCVKCGQPAMKQKGALYCSARCSENASQIRYRHRNPEKFRERSRRQNSKPERKEYNRAWAKTQQRAYTPEQRARKLAKKKEWRQNNGDIIRANNEKWRKAHPDSLRDFQSARRARKRGNTCDKPAIIKAAISKAKNVCYWCGKRLSQNGYHIDHIMPLCKGGPHAAHNLVKSCPACNSKKSGQHPNDFIREGQLVLL